MTSRALGLFVLACAAAAAEPARIVETEVLSHDGDKARLSGQVGFEGPWPPTWSAFFQVRRPDGALLKDAEGKDVLLAGTAAGPDRFEADLPLAPFRSLESGEVHRLKVECHVWDRAGGKWVVSGFENACVLTIALDAQGEIAFVGYAAVWAARLTDPSVVIRRATTVALRDDFLPARTAAPLAAAMKDPDAEVRRGAALALRHIGARSALTGPALEGAWNDADGWTRFYAAEWFVEAGSPPPAALDALGTLLSDAELRDLAASALVRAGKSSGKALRAALDAGGEGAVSAACALLEIGEAGNAAFPILDAAIGRALSEPAALKTGWTLCNALERISPEAADALPLLVERLGKLAGADPVWKTAALRAIAKFGPAGKPASPSITALAADDDERVREAAKEALRAIEGTPR